MGDMSELPDAPTTRHDRETGWTHAMPEYEIAMTLVLKTHGVDAGDAVNRAMQALGVPRGPFTHSVDRVSGEGFHTGTGSHVVFHADVRNAQIVMTREVTDEIRSLYE